MRSRVLFLAVSFVLSLATFAAAQPLSDRVPGDAIIYIGWSGAEGMGPEYAGSHLKGVLDASDAPKLFTDFLPKAFAKIGEHDRDAKQAGEMIDAIVKPMWKHPTAIYFSGLDWPDNGPPMPKFVALCDAGPDAPNLVVKVKEALAEAGESPVPVSISETGGLVSLVIGKASDDKTRITDAAGFKAALAKTHVKPIAVVYIDGEALIKTIKVSVEKSGDRQAMREWPKARTALGLDGFKAGIWTAAFEDKNWSTRAYIAAPSPRTGLLKFLDSQPLPEDTMKVVPQSAIMAAAGRFDVGKAYDSLRELIVSLDPRAIKEFDGEISKLNTKLGMDFRKDVLGSLGDTWVYYVDPMTGGNGVLGGVVLNKVADPAKTEEALTSLEAAINKLIIEESHGEVKIGFRQAKLDGLDVHYFPAPMISPAWAMKDGQLVVGFYPQTVLGAARHMGSGGKSLLDNPSYVELRKKLGDTPAAAMNYLDLPKLAPQGYATWLMLSRVVGFGDLFGVESPLMILPPMYKLQEHLAASGSATWSTDDGVYFRAVSPFPGSNIIAADPLSMVGLLQPMAMVGMMGMGVRSSMVHEAHVDMAPPKTYYTTDDGKTWFADDASKIPPFKDAHEKTAVRVYVFKCGETGKPFPGYMERYTPAAAEKMEELVGPHAHGDHNGDPMAVEKLQLTGMEVKSPKGDKWVLRNSPEAEKIMNEIKCPDGTTNNLEPVSPED